MADTDAPLIYCATCGRALSSQVGRGRRRIYCGATCRSAARRRRAGVTPVKLDLTALSRADSMGGVTGRTAGPLEAIASALEVARAAETGLRDAVDAAREAGCTWSEIGNVLGTTRQAAFQRFGRPVDPRTGEPMSASVLPDAAQKAAAVFANLAAGNWDDARRGFDAQVTRVLPDAGTVAATWAAIVGQIGRYEQQVGEPFVLQLGDYTVVDIPLRFEAGEQVGRVSFNSDGTVAGLFVLPGGQV